MFDERAWALQLFYAKEEENEVECREHASGILYEKPPVDLEAFEEAEPFVIPWTIVILVVAMMFYFIMRDGKVNLQMIAAKYGSTLVLKILAISGVDMNVQVRGITPLVTAAQNGHFNCVKWLYLAGARAGEGKAFDLLADHGNATMIRVMMDVGANGTEALDRAVKDKRHIAVRTLIRSGVTPSVKLKRTANLALFEASKHGDVEKVRSLVELNFIDLDKMEVLSGTSLTNYTATMMAASNGHAEVVKVLIEAGADPNICGTQNIHCYAMAQARSFSVIKALLDGGATPSGEALVKAAQRGDILSVKLLLDAGVGPDAYYFNDTALLQALKSENVPIIRLLLEAGANSANVMNYAVRRIIEMEGEGMDLFKAMLELRSEFARDTFKVLEIGSVRSAPKEILRRISLEASRKLPKEELEAKIAKVREQAVQAKTDAFRYKDMAQQEARSDSSRLYTCKLLGTYGTRCRTCAQNSSSAASSSETIAVEAWKMAEQVIDEEALFQWEQAECTWIAAKNAWDKAQGEWKFANKVARG